MPVSLTVRSAGLFAKLMFVLASSVGEALVGGVVGTGGLLVNLIASTQATAPAIVISTSRLKISVRVRTLRRLFRGEGLDVEMPISNKGACGYGMAGGGVTTGGVSGSWDA